MTDFTKLSDKELSEAINFHRRQRNMSRGVNEAAHMRQTQTVRLLEAEEARRLNEKAELTEAVTVDKKNYSWGKMMTVRHGSSHSFPLHPEHQEKIKNLKDGESTAFKDETGSHVTAHREGDKVHLKLRGANEKTTVAHSHFTESVQIDELKKSTLASYVKKASTDQYLKGQAVQYHTNKAQTADGAFAKQSKEKHYDAADKALKKASNRDTGIGRAVDRLAKEEVELTEAETNYVIKHKKTKQVLNTHSDYNTAKDEHEGLGDEKSEYGIYKQTKKDAALRNRNTYREEVEQIDEISASTLQSYVDKARDSKKAEMKNRTAAKNDMKKYGMAMDKKAHDDAARKVVNRGTGISVANRKLNTYPKDAAKAKVMAREEVEQIDEISDDLKARYLDKAVQQRYDRFVTPRNTSAPKLKGKAKKDADAAREKANAKDSRRADIIDKTAEKLTGKPHYNKMSTTTTPAVHGNTNDWWKGKKYSKEEVELDEASYRDSGYANMLKASRKADKEADKMRAKHEKEAKKAGEPKAEFKEEADLRITKVYNKWPKKATYAVHTPDRKYFKEFDSMEAAKAHHAEKSGK